MTITKAWLPVGTTEVTLKIAWCWCGIPFAVPSQLHRMWYEQGISLSCPLGHGTVRKKTETNRLREDVALLEGRLVHERDQREATERRLVAQKAATTRVKNRARAGVCPDCKRTFSNVVRHMETKHPESRPVEGGSGKA